ncbi:hypothetical protein POV26_07895 [Aequorivita todarodis]|uniref:hypothetical protein n=1 Tax=Aequorivita todarodis TaxID=2036821 RepID=UPI00234FF91B|nr:hypothetical protein [Aequorivita todarodis]MDC8000955.1 hypothetical protein [Aequorivita todarodis]
MFKTLFIIVFIFFGSYSIMAQKTIQKEFSSEGIKTLSIADDAIYKITIQSSEESILKISAHISGEHSESVIIEEKIADGILSLKTGFAPFFKMENDKLAAHKVMAIELKITVPEKMAVEIKSKLASVYTDGIYKNLTISLENGNCVLNDFLGNAQLKTIAGNITVQAQNNVSGKAISKNGTVENNFLNKGKFFVEAESINGNISFLQTK